MSFDHYTDLLGDLADPGLHRSTFELGSTPDKHRLLDQLEMMIRIRVSEECIGDLVINREVRGPCHLGIGQEAIAVGVAASLRSSDRVFGGHRGHSQYLAMGGSVHGLLAEVLGRATGCSRGMGGSQHLTAKDKGFWASVPIVGATVPIATGAGLAAKMDGKGDVAVSFFGDSAVEEGAVQESLNLASKMGLPVLFVCENNLFASHMHIGHRQPANSTARFAEAHRIPHETVDGNDVAAVERAARAFVERARNGGGPAFLECITYRWRGHVGPSEDIDVGVKRSEVLQEWKKRDPIRRLEESMMAVGLLSDAESTDLWSKVKSEIAEALDVSRQDPYPDQSLLLDAVYHTESHS